MRSPIKKTPQKSRQLSTQRSSISTKSLVNTLYFCHYRNAMYMGGIKSFQKHGPGILLHDNGTCILSNYYNDIIHGHNIYFSNRCLASAQYIKNRLSQIVYRTDGYLLSLKYNSDNLLDGNCILLNYILKSIIYVTFKKGNLIEKKQQKDYTVINKVFQIGNIQFLIGKKHARVTSYDIDKMFPNIAVQKNGNKINIGYSKNGLMNGLGFSMFIRGSHGGLNLDTHRNQDQFELNLVQRGYYNNSQLNGLGQKRFKNGNLYFGQFKDDIFEGNGILKNAAKQNWISGYFQKNNLIDLVQYNNQGDYKRCQKIIQSLHEKKTNWINNEITIISFQTFDKQIQKILSMSQKNYTKTLQQRKQQILKKIQRNFINQNNIYGLSNNQEDTIQLTQTARNLQTYQQQSNASPSLDNSKNLQNSNYNDFVDSVNKRFVRSFIPEGFSNSSNQINSLSFNMTNHYKDKMLRSPEQNQSIPNESTIQLNSKYNNLSSSQRKQTLRKSKIFNKDYIQYNKAIATTLRPPLSKSQTGLFKLHNIQERKKSMTSTSPNYHNNLTNSRRKKNLPIFEDSNSYNLHNSRNNNPNFEQVYNQNNQYSNSPQSSKMRLDLSKKQYLNNYKQKQALDSKRIINRSRIFRYLNDQSIQQPPKFNYKMAEQYMNSQRQSSSRIQITNLNAHNNNNFTFTN